MNECERISLASHGMQECTNQCTMVSQHPTLPTSNPIQSNQQQAIGQSSLHSPSPPQPGKASHCSRLSHTYVITHARTHATEKHPPSSPDARWLIVWAGGVGSQWAGLAAIRPQHNHLPNRSSLLFSPRSLARTYLCTGRTGPLTSSHLISPHLTTHIH